MISPCLAKEFGLIIDFNRIMKAKDISELD